MFVPHHARMDKLLYSKKESAHLLSLSLRSVDSLINQKDLEACRVGRRVLVTRKSLEEFAQKGDRYEDKSADERADDL
jgi:excisionase family DNA binding protein